LFAELEADAEDAAQRRPSPLLDAALGESFFALGFGEQRRERASLPTRLTACGRVVGFFSGFVPGRAEHIQARPQERDDVDLVVRGRRRGPFRLAVGKNVASHTGPRSSHRAMASTCAKAVMERARRRLFLGGGGRNRCERSSNSRAAITRRSAFWSSGRRGGDCAMAMVNWTTSAGNGICARSIARARASRSNPSPCE
jgi:hypothetical protein